MASYVDHHPIDHHRKPPEHSLTKRPLPVMTMPPDGPWERLEDLGSSLRTRGRYARHHVWRCRCRVCGAVRDLSESYLSACRINGYQHCVRCRDRRAAGLLAAGRMRDKQSLPGNV